MVTKLKKLPYRMREVCERAAQERIDQQIAAVEAKGTEEARSNRRGASSAVAGPGAKGRSGAQLPDIDHADGALPVVVLRLQHERRNVALDLDGDALCHFTFYTTLPMYKPIVLAGVSPRCFPSSHKCIISAQFGRPRPSNSAWE